MGKKLVWCNFLVIVQNGQSQYITEFLRQPNTFFLIKTTNQVKVQGSI